MTRVLIIEDDLNALSGLSELLRSEGYDARGASTGEQGVKLFEKHLPEVVLCDYRLPDIDGIRVCRKLRNLNPDTILILITAFANSEVLKAAEQLAVAEVFRKPINLEALLDFLARLQNPAAGAKKVQVKTVRQSSRSLG